MENLILWSFENSLLNLDIQKLIRETVKVYVDSLADFEPVSKICDHWNLQP
jgi:predicted nucleic-acid-binding protein